MKRHSVKQIQLTVENRPSEKGRGKWSRRRWGLWREIRRDQKARGGVDRLSLTGGARSDQVERPGSRRACSLQEEGCLVAAINKRVKKRGGSEL